MVRQGDLAQIGWNDGPIELLVIDAMKSWKLTGPIIDCFYRALIPGSRLVVLPDAGHAPFDEQKDAFLAAFLDFIDSPQRQ